MEEFFIKAGQLILSLSILIVLHEMGHFIPAKLFKTRVEKFYLFFNPWFSLFKTKRGETEYGLGWLPLGGYVKISGMIDESMDKDQMAKPPQPWEFRSKPVWQRLIIMIGGVTVNLILGILIYMMVLGIWGRDQLKVENLTHGYAVAGVLEDYGMRDGDVVTHLDGEPVEDAMDVGKDIFLHGKREMKVVHADGTDTTINLPEDVDWEMFKEDGGPGLMPRVFPVVGEVQEDMPAHSAGIETGDSILSVNGQSIVYWDEMTDLIKSHKEEEVEIIFVREGEVDTMAVVTNEDGLVGIGNGASIKSMYEIDHINYGFFESIPKGFNYGINTLSDYVTSMKFLFSEKGASEMGGFGTIGGLFSPTWDWQRFWEMTAFISIILAFMNILPIPALDGGHVMFLIYEGIAGKPPSQKFMEYAQMVGLIILLGLVLYANGNDIVKAFQ